MNLTHSQLAALRDLNHTEGWELYKRIAREYVEQLNRDYLRESLTQDEAWEARARVRGMMSFQAMMEERVSSAIGELEFVIAQQMNPVPVPEQVDNAY